MLKICIYVFVLAILFSCTKPQEQKKGDTVEFIYSSIAGPKKAVQFNKKDSITKKGVLILKYEDKKAGHSFKLAIDTLRNEVITIDDDSISYFGSNKIDLNGKKYTITSSVSTHGTSEDRITYCKECGVLFLERAGCFHNDFLMYSGADTLCKTLLTRALLEEVLHKRHTYPVPDEIEKE